jgi:Flavodoxin-like fold
MPAMMKGYIDRVFARGFAYESHNGSVRGLLSGKKSVLRTISGAPLPLLVKSGNWSATPLECPSRAVHGARSGLRTGEFSRRLPGQKTMTTPMTQALIGLTRSAPPAVTKSAAASNNSGLVTGDDLE